MAITIENKASPYLKQLGLVAPNFINEGISKGAAIFYKKIQEKASTYNDDIFTQFHDSKGRRGIAGTGSLNARTLRRGEVLTSFGRPFERVSRINPNTKAQGADNIAKLTRWKTYPSKLKAVIGWIATKSYKNLKYKDGMIVGEQYVKGTSLIDYTKGGKQNIGELLEHGGREVLTTKQKAFFKAMGMAKAARRGYVLRKARPLIAPAYSMGKSEAENKMEQVIRKVVDYKATNSNIRKIA